jgi:hypothetical protein
MPATPRRLVAAVAVAVACAALLSGHAAAAAPVPEPAQLVPSPNVAGGDNELAAVAAVAPGLAVAVGFWHDGSRQRTLVEYWSGRDWRVQPSADATGFDNALYGVSGVAATDVWAVGAAATGGGSAAPTRTLVERFDGQAWRVVPSPSPSPGTNELRAVAAAARDDVWAVGLRRSEADSAARTLTEHWDGAAWTVVPSPDPGQDNRLDGVAGTPATGVWAVGATGPEGGAERPFILRWTGTGWQEAPVPDVGPHDAALTAVAVVSPTDAWAVGTIEDEAARPLVLRWDGVEWRHVSTVDVAGYDLTGVTALSATDVWAVGYLYGPDGDTDPALLHANARGWTGCRAVTQDLVSAAGGIAPAGGGAVWAVGHHQIAERDGVASTLVIQARAAGSGRC